MIPPWLEHATRASVISWLVHAAVTAWVGLLGALYGAALGEPGLGITAGCTLAATLYTLREVIDHERRGTPPELWLDRAGDAVAPYLVALVAAIAFT